MGLTEVSDSVWDNRHHPLCCCSLQHRHVVPKNSNSFYLIPLSHGTLFLFSLCDALDYASILELPSYITPATWFPLKLLAQT